VSILTLGAHRSLPVRDNEHEIVSRTSLLFLSAFVKLLQISLTRKKESEKTGSSPSLRPSAKARHTKLRCAFACCVHFVDRMPSAGSA
jgi:hypothetical protein